MPKIRKSIPGFVLGVAGAFSCMVGVFLLLQEPDESSIATRYKGSSVCGLSAVANICRMWGIQVDMSEAYSRAREPLDHKRGISLLGCKRALEASGIGCEALRFGSIGDLPEGTPILFTLERDKDRVHAVVVVRHAKRVLLIDGHKIYKGTSNDLDNWRGNIVLTTSMKTNSDKEKIP